MVQKTHVKHPLSFLYKKDFGIKTSGTKSAKIQKHQFYNYDGAESWTGVLDPGGLRTKKKSAGISGFAPEGRKSPERQPVLD